MLTALALAPFATAQWLTIPDTSHPLKGASWIWVNQPEIKQPLRDSPAGTYRFRTTWVMEKAATAELWFTADNSCTVTLNGKVVGQSTDWSQIGHASVPVKAGANEIEVVATNTPGNPGGNAAGLIVAGRAGSQTLFSDAKWTCEGKGARVLGAYSMGPWNLKATEGPSPVFRRDFRVAKAIKRATARVIGLGQFDFWVNGKRQGNAYLNQPWSQYDKTLYWTDFDVTKSLKKGANALGMELGNSFYRVAQPPAGRYTKGDSQSDFSEGRPYLLAVELTIEHTDGTTMRVTTDQNWRWRIGPYQLSHVHSGEDYDARLDSAAWFQAGADMSEWKPPVVTPAPKAALEPINFPLLTAHETWKPTKILSPEKGVWSYVFPQNAMAVVRMKVRGKRGAVVTVRPSEVMNEQGKVQQLNLWGGDASCRYTLRGEATESREWRFWYHGFQYVEVIGAVPKGQPNPEGLPVVESLEMVSIRTANPETGAFSCSNPTLNGAHHLIDWAIRSNMAYVMSDCPQREKLGWQECSYLLYDSFNYRFDCDRWFEKIMRDQRDSQEPNGLVWTTVPHYLQLPDTSPYAATVEWGASGVLVPWYVYQRTGKSQVLVENYDMMRRYVDWIESKSKNGIAPAGLGDWYDYGHGQSPGPSRYTPTQLTSTAMWKMCLDAVIAAGKLTGASDVPKYIGMREEVRTAFLRDYYDPITKRLKNTGSVQSGHAMALYADLIPKEDRPAVLQAIIEELESRDYQQTPGDIGHLYFVRALAEAGRSDVLHKVYSRTGLGSYGGMLAKGLTTLPETWDAITVGSNSLNHCMLGHAMEWFYGYVLGIRQGSSVGWKNLIIAPEPGPLAHAEGKTRIPAGEVRVAWKQGALFELRVTTPKSAAVSLPGSGSVKVNGKPVASTPGVFGRPTITVGKGSWVITQGD